MSIGYVLHDLSMFSPPEEIKALLDELHAEPEKGEHLKRQIRDLEKALIDAMQLRKDLADNQRHGNT